jgi:hypothetical protein
VIQIGHQVVEGIGRIVPGSAFAAFQFKFRLFHDASPLLQNKELQKWSVPKVSKL